MSDSAGGRGSVVNGIQEAAFECNYKVILLHCAYAPAKDLLFGKLLRTERMDGAIWIPATTNLKPHKKSQNFAFPPSPTLLSSGEGRLLAPSPGGRGMG
jgi:DNA-binding LacI/PurR family transcriptional regulator